MLTFNTLLGKDRVADFIPMVNYSIKHVCVIYSGLISPLFQASRRNKTSQSGLTPMNLFRDLSGSLKTFKKIK